MSLINQHNCCKLEQFLGQANIHVMKSIYLLLIFSFIFAGAHAQTYKIEMLDTNNTKTIKYSLDTYDIIKKLDIKKYGILKGVVVYPNPVHNVLNIEMPDYGDFEITMFNKDSKRIFKRKLNDDIETSFDLSYLENGLYFLGIVDATHKKAIILKIQKL